MQIIKVDTCLDYQLYALTPLKVNVENKLSTIYSRVFAVELVGRYKRGCLEQLKATSTHPEFEQPRWLNSNLSKVS